MSSNYSVELSNQSEKFLKKLKNEKLLIEIVKTFELLQKNPLLGKFLQGDLKGYHSYRISKYRIIYKIINDKNIIHIIDISHRKDSYR